MTKILDISLLNKKRKGLKDQKDLKDNKKDTIRKVNLKVVGNKEDIMNLVNSNKHRKENTMKIKEKEENHSEKILEVEDLVVDSLEMILMRDLVEWLVVL